MSVDADAPGTGEMTLAFDLSAVKELAEPEAALSEAREWSRYVGVVGTDPDAVAASVREYDLEQDFELGDRDIWLLMSDLRESTGTPRHVFVGTTAEHRRIAQHVGWEFRHVTEAAEKAEWVLEDERTDESGLLSRLRERLSNDSS